jgi:hypothetical protein
MELLLVHGPTMSQHILVLFSFAVKCFTERLQNYENVIFWFVLGEKDECELWYSETYGCSEAD